MFPGDLPYLIKALYERANVADALYEMHGDIWHQGTVYPATVPAIAFLTTPPCPARSARAG